jgi:hypothetical protein
VFDADDFFWLPSDPPFIAARPATERVAMLLRKLPRDGGWVFAGSALGWGEALAPLYDLIVYLWLDPDQRLDRLRRRERERHGSRIDPGGDMENTHAAFMKWATAYDTGGPEQRSRAAHEAWLATQTARVLRLEASETPDVLAATAIAALG